MLIDKKVLLEMGLPWDNVIYDKVIDNSRWSIIHEIIFKMDDKFYQAHYQVGATESQDERPWEYEDKVEIIEVEEKEVLVKKWFPIKEVING